MEGSKYNCRGDGCKCQVSTEDEYCDKKCFASNDYGHCSCGHSSCAHTTDDAKRAAREATVGDEKVS